MRLPTPILTKYETTLVLIPENFAIPIDFGLFSLVFDIHSPSQLYYLPLYKKSLWGRAFCAEQNSNMLLPVPFPPPSLTTFTRNGNRRKITKATFKEHIELINLNFLFSNLLFFTSSV